MTGTTDLDPEQMYRSMTDDELQKMLVKETCLDRRVLLRKELRTRNNSSALARAVSQIHRPLERQIDPPLIQSQRVGTFASQPPLDHQPKDHNVVEDNTRIDKADTKQTNSEAQTEFEKLQRELRDTLDLNRRKELRLKMKALQASMDPIPDTTSSMGSQCRGIERSQTSVTDRRPLHYFTPNSRTPVIDGKVSMTPLGPTPRSNSPGDYNGDRHYAQSMDSKPSTTQVSTNGVSGSVGNHEEVSKKESPLKVNQQTHYKVTVKEMDDVVLRCDWPENEAIPVSISWFFKDRDINLYPKIYFQNMTRSTPNDSDVRLQFSGAMIRRHPGIYRAQITLGDSSINKSFALTVDKKAQPEDITEGKGFGYSLQNQDNIKEGENILRDTNNTDVTDFNVFTKTNDLKEEKLRREKKEAQESKEVLEAKEAAEKKEAKEKKEAQKAKEVKQAKEMKDAKEALEKKEQKERKEAQKAKEAQEAKEKKEAKEALKIKEAKEAKEAKERKEAKEAIERNLEKERKEAQKAKEAQEAREKKEAKEKQKTKEAEEARIKAQIKNTNEQRESKDDTYKKEFAVTPSSEKSKSDENENRLRCNKEGDDKPNIKANALTEGKPMNTQHRSLHSSATFQGTKSTPLNSKMVDEGSVSTDVPKKVNVSRVTSMREMFEKKPGTSPVGLSADPTRRGKQWTPSLPEERKTDGASYVPVVAKASVSPSVTVGLQVQYDSSQPTAAIRSQANMSGNPATTLTVPSQDARRSSNVGIIKMIPMMKSKAKAARTTVQQMKEHIINFCSCNTKEYENVSITNYSSSWADGLAFCALIHHFYPDSFDYGSLSPSNRAYNFTLAFDTAQRRGDIDPLLETEDMLLMDIPDSKCVYTYVQHIYGKLNTHPRNLHVKPEEKK